MIELFDVQAGFGGTVPGEASAVSAEEWTSEMQRLGIGAALVRIAPDKLACDTGAANAALYAACTTHRHLTACPILVPDTTPDAPSCGEVVDGAIAQKAGAAYLRPAEDYWSLLPCVSDRLFLAMQERRLPAYCHVGKFTLEQVAELAGKYPYLPFIVAGLPYRCQRVLLPLLEAFPNVYASTGSNYSLHFGIEQIVDRVEPTRLLFGTGFPDVEPMAAVAQLMYADIPDDAKQQIGAGNLRNLLERIQR